MSTLWDCGPGTTGVTFGFLSMRALFCPHLDTSKTPTEKKVQEPNRAKFEPESRPISFLVISCVIFREKRKKKHNKKSDLKGLFWICFSPLINHGLHDVSCTQQQSLPQRSSGQEESHYSWVQGGAVSIKPPLSENSEAPLCSAAAVKNVTPSSQTGKMTTYLLMCGFDGARSDWFSMWFGGCVTAYIWRFITYYTVHVSAMWVVLCDFL